VERVIGTLRRELLDHSIVLNEQHLRRLLRTFVEEYYHRGRTHLSLAKDSPDPRRIEPPSMGNVVEIPVVCGLQSPDSLSTFGRQSLGAHRYAREAA
jgi:putative transposase